ncbi:MAG TPA: ankyrin repeat domain-containing protein [Solirubrobacteraceae bacterium]|jgi:ankyrin repeat protein|nr:ankyrin repeat domain-containing protein [Solirubrobacteraceae bacterium]
MHLHRDDPITLELVAAIRTGAVSDLAGLLDEQPLLAGALIEGRRGASSTPLHVATDWPGYHPNGPAVVRTLLDAGADPDAPIVGGRHSETALHSAASSDDVDVAEVLIDGGANVEAPGGSIDVTPLDNAVGYGCWHVARLLVARGAVVDKLWHASALGMLTRVTELLDASPPPSADQIDEAFWQACHGGQRRCAELLLGRGADLDAAPSYASGQTPLDIADGLDTRRENVVTWLRELGARSTDT